MKYSDWFIDPVHNNWPNEKWKKHCMLYKYAYYPKPSIHTDQFGRLHCVNYNNPYNIDIPILTDEHLENIKQYVKMRLRIGWYYDAVSLGELRKRFNFNKILDEEDRRVELPF